MKAILKNDRKVVREVIPYLTDKTYIEVTTGFILDENELEFIEYQGG